MYFVQPIKWLFYGPILSLSLEKVILCVIIKGLYKRMFMARLLNYALESDCVAAS